MRVPTAVAVLILATGVAPSVALPLPGFTSEHAARTPARPLPEVPQVKPPPNPAVPQTPAAPPALEPLPLYPNRGPYQGQPPGTYYEPPAPQQSGLKKWWGKVFGRTLIATPPSDEVFGQPNSRRELLERFDELLTELAARAYEEESLTTPMDDLD